MGRCVGQVGTQGDEEMSTRLGLWWGGARHGEAALRAAAGALVFAAALFLLGQPCAAAREYSVSVDGQPVAFDGIGPVEDLVHPGSTVLILSDDHTRLTKTALILPALLSRLESAGVRPGDVTILLAYGTHRAMSDAEKARKLGRGILTKYRVVDHDWRNTATLIGLGKTRSGIDVQVNRLLREHDVIIGVGLCGPHPLAGWSGGCKMVEPGVCGRETTEQVHWLAAETTYRMGSLVGLSAEGDYEGPDPNPVRREIEAVGVQAGLAAVFNAIHDSRGNMVDAVYGHPIKAFRAGVPRARNILGVRVPRRFDVVVTDSYPCDINLWQANKAIRCTDLMVKDGGVIVLITPCPEGGSGEHPEVEKYGYMLLDQVKEKVASGEIRDLVAAGNMAIVGRIVRQRLRCVIVSPGLSEEQASRLGLIYAPDPSTGVQKALDMTSRTAEVAVLVHGGESLPIVER